MRLTKAEKYLIQVGLSMANKGVEHIDDILNKRYPIEGGVVYGETIIKDEFWKISLREKRLTANARRERVISESGFNDKEK